MKLYGRSLLQLAAVPLGLAADVVYEVALLLEGVHGALVGE